MKAREGDDVRLVAGVTGDDGHTVIPAGTVGTVVEVYADPEAYAVDITIDGEPDNVYALGDQVEPVSAV